MNDLIVMKSSWPLLPRESMNFLRSLSIYSKTSMSLVFCVNDVVERDGYFSCLSSFMREISRMGGRGGAFFAVEVDLFKGDEFAGLAVAALEIPGRGWNVSLT